MNLSEELDRILDGIDKDENEYINAWWETSTGADFGAKKKAELIALFKRGQVEARIEEWRNYYSPYALLHATNQRTMSDSIKTRIAELKASLKEGNHDQ